MKGAGATGRDLMISIIAITLQVEFSVAEALATLFGVPDRGSANPTPLGGEDDMLNV